MRKFIMVFIAFLLVVLPINGAFMDKANAASSRVAVIKELKGTVKVKKAGGSKEFTAFAKMSLNEGDVLSVGGSGSAVLQFANGTSEDDKMTVSANTKLSFSKLSSKKGTTTKVSMWSGNAWVDVKSIASASDEFTLETPTAVMGVRGTHFFVGVNPVTGVTNMTVAAGIVRTSANKPSGGQAQDVYPTQQVILSPVEQGKPNMLKGPVDIDQIVSQSSPDIIKAFLLSAPDVVAENNALMDTYLSKMSVGKPEQELKRVRGNIENIVGAIVSNTEKQSKLKELQAFIASLELLLGRDLSGIALGLSDEEKEQLAKLGERLAELQKQAEAKQKQEQLARDLELQALLKKKLDDQKKSVEEEIKKKKDKAYEDYESKLSQLEKDRLKNDKKNLEGTTNSNQTGSSNNGSGPGPSPSGTSQDATLSNIRLFKYEGVSSPPAEPTPSAGLIAFTETFSSSNTSYSAEVASSVTYVYVKPFTTNSGASVTVNGISVTSGSSSGAIPLNFGATTVTIVVTAADGVSTKTYSVQLNRIGSARLLGFMGLTLAESFDPEVFQYEAEPVYPESNLFIIPRPGTSITVKLNEVNLSPEGSGSIYSPHFLIGENVLEVTVTPEVGMPVPYKFNVMNKSVVHFSSLVSHSFIINQVDSQTYAGIMNSSDTQFTLDISKIVADSIVQVFKDDTEIIGSGMTYELTGITAGWNVFQIRVSDPQARFPAQDYTLQVWKGDASQTSVNSWVITDNEGKAGQADTFGGNYWYIRYNPGATSLKIKPLLSSGSPFTVHSIEYLGYPHSVSTPDETGVVTVPVSSYAQGILLLENEGKLLKIDLTFTPEAPVLRPAGVTSWTTTVVPSSGSPVQLTWVNTSNNDVKRYYAILPTDTDTVTINATLAEGVQSKFDPEDAYASDNLSITISDFALSGVTPITLITKIGTEEVSYNLYLMSPTAAANLPILNMVRASYWNGESTTDVNAEKSDDAYYLMLPVEVYEDDPDGTVALSAMPSDEHDTIQWIIDEELVDQNEESNDVVQAAPSGFNIYYVIDTDITGGRVAVYPVYVYQGTPDIQDSGYIYIENQQQWNINLSYDPDSSYAWSMPFQLHLPSGFTAEIVSEDNGNVSQDASGVFHLSGHLTQAEVDLDTIIEKVFSVTILNEDGDDTATYKVVVKVFGPSS